MHKEVVYLLEYVHEREIVQEVASAFDEFGHNVVKADAQVLENNDYGAKLGRDADCGSQVGNDYIKKLVDEALFSSLLEHLSNFGHYLLC